MSHNKGAFYMAQTQKELRNALRTYKARNGLTWAHAQNQRLHDELDRVAFILLNNNDAKELEGTL